MKQRINKIYKERDREKIEVLIFHGRPERVKIEEKLYSLEKLRVANIVVRMAP